MALDQLLNLMTIETIQYQDANILHTEINKIVKTEITEKFGVNVFFKPRSTTIHLLAFGTDADCQIILAKNFIDELIEKKSVVTHSLKISDFITDKSSIKSMAAAFNADKEIKKQLKEQFGATLEVVDYEIQLSVPQSNLKALVLEFDDLMK